MDPWLSFILLASRVVAQPCVLPVERGVSLCPSKPTLCLVDPEATSWCHAIASCDEFHCMRSSEGCHLRVSSSCYDDLVSVRVAAKRRAQYFDFCLSRGSCQTFQGETVCGCGEPTHRWTHCEISTERKLQEVEPTFAPSGSAYQTGTFYPTGSPPPTTSAYPTVTSFPTPSATGTATDGTFSPTFSLYPTGTFLPTGSPLPTSSTYPTITSVPSLVAKTTVVPSIGPTSTGDEGLILPSIAPSTPTKTSITTNPSAIPTSRPTRFPIARQEPTPSYRPTQPSVNMEREGGDDDDLTSAEIGAILVGIGALLIVVTWFVRPCSGRTGNRSSHRRGGYRSELELQHFEDDLI